MAIFLTARMWLPLQASLKASVIIFAGHDVDVHLIPNIKKKKGKKKEQQVSHVLQSSQMAGLQRQRA